MDIRHRQLDHVVVLELEGRALVKAIQWEQLAPFVELDAEVLALDVSSAEFVSSLFWQSCVQAGGQLSEYGKSLVLLHVAERHRHVLELVEGTSRLAICRTEQELVDRYISKDVTAAGGVSRQEKHMLLGKGATDRGRQ